MDWDGQPFATLAEDSDRSQRVEAAGWKTLTPGSRPGQAPTLFQRAKEQEARPGVEVGDPSVELAGESAADGRVAKPVVEPQRSLVELVDAETNLRDAAVAGPAVGFGHQSRGDSASLMGLSDDELLDHGVASRRQGGDIGHFKPFVDLDPHQPHDNAIHFSHKKRLIGIVELRVKQAPRASWPLREPKPVTPLPRMQPIRLGE